MQLQFQKFPELFSYAATVFFQELILHKYSVDGYYFPCFSLYCADYLISLCSKKIREQNPGNGFGTRSTHRINQKEDP